MTLEMTVGVFKLVLLLPVLPQKDLETEASRYNANPTLVCVTIHLTMYLKKAYNIEI